MPGVVGAQLDLHRLGDSRRDVRLQRLDVPSGSACTHRTRRHDASDGINQSEREANLVSDPRDRSLEHAVGARGARKIVDLRCAISVAHRRAGGDDANAIDAAQRGQSSASVKPSAKNACAASPVVFSSGRTASVGIPSSGLSSRCAL